MSVWHEKLGVISIGAQGGGPETSRFGKLKVGLWRLTTEYCLTTPSTEVIHLALALRIGGSIQDFVPENIHRVRRSRKDKSIGCDIDIPFKIWEKKSDIELREFLSVRVREAVVLMFARLKRDREDVKETAVLEELDRVIEEFLKT